MCWAFGFFVMLGFGFVILGGGLVWVSGWFFVCGYFYFLHC